MGHLINMEETTAKIDKLFYGILFGSMLPVIGFFLSYIVKTRATNVTFDQFVYLAFNGGDQQQMDILIFCLLPNMLMFYISNFRYRWNEFTKGLVGTTVVALLALIFLTY